MKSRVAIIEGVRTPFCRYLTEFKELQAEELGAFCLSSLMSRVPIDQRELEGVILGNVMQPPHATNIARVSALLGSLPQSVKAHTINRNCSSGIDAIIDATNRILLEDRGAFIAGGTESLSNIPLLFPDSMKTFLLSLQKAKSFGAKLKTVLSFRPSMLKPLLPSIKDPLCNLTMGQTAEILAKEFGIRREEQDAFALRSQKRALAAEKEGFFDLEIAPLFNKNRGYTLQTKDVGPRDTSMEQLAKLRPAFQKDGTVTAGNASQITDGASCLLLMSEKRARSLGLKPKGYIGAYGMGALKPSQMGLGPLFALFDLFSKTKGSLKDFDLIEINEAFAAQVLAVIKAADSKKYCKEHFQAPPLGEIDQEKLNIGGGAIALGHPFGATGGRLVITLLNQLRKNNLRKGLVTLCVGGGQGLALEIEAAD